MRSILVGGGCCACLDVGRPTIITLSTQTRNLLSADDELEDGPKDDAKSIYIISFKKFRFLASQISHVWISLAERDDS